MTTKIDWDKLEMERRIEKASDDAYHAEQRMKAKLAAAREDYDSEINGQADELVQLQERVAQLEKTVAELVAKLTVGAQEENTQ